MTNTPFKFKLTQDTVNTTKSKQINLNFPQGKNGYRIDHFRLMCAGTVVKKEAGVLVQFSYKDQNGATIESIEEDDEIYTDGIRTEDLVTSTFQKLAELKYLGLKFPVGRIATKDYFFLNFDSWNQDAPLEGDFEIFGQYVKVQNYVKNKLEKTTVL